MNVRIRQASIEDLVGLRALEAVSFTTDCISPRQMRYLVTQANALCEIAEVDGQLAGYLVVLTPKKRAARIYSLAVMPDYRGQGIGSALMHSAIAYLTLQGYQACDLEVKAEDQLTQSLYRRLGFNEIKRMPQYYENGDDALKMRKTL